MKKKDNYDKGSHKELIEESAEDLYENAPCGYLSYLPDGTIIKINNTLLSWTGYQREDLLSTKRFQDLLSVGDKLFYETHHAPLLQMQGFVNELNYQLVKKDQDILPVLVNSVQLKDDKGKPLLVRATIFDITDRKKYERELLHARKKAEQAAKVKAEFLSTVSHEIRTPMNAIIGITDLLLKTNVNQQQLEYLKTLKFSSDNLLNLINDILDFNKIEAGRVTIEEKNFNVKELIFNILHSLSVKAEEKDLKVEVHLDEKLPEYLIGDPVKIGQVLTNLLSNAIKFTEKGFIAIHLEVKESGHRKVSVDFSVKDTGIGISPDRIAQIFEEFTQESYDINLKYGGTGLGLAICQKILGLYDSKMEVKSEQGKGSVFTFNLTLKRGKADKNSAYAPESTSDKEQSIRGIRLLIAEDNPINVFVVSQYLDTWGVKFDVAENGAQAIDQLSRQDYNLILMDLQMPQMDGYTAARKIRSLPEEKFQKLPIVALSASNRFDHEARMEASGINDFISKPFNPKELYAKIAFYGLNQATESQSLSAIRPDTSENKASSHVISLDQYIELTGNKKEPLVKLINMTIHNFENYKNNFRKALETRDSEALGLLAHKIKVTIGYLQADNLQTSISNSRKLLKEVPDDNSRLKQVIQNLEDAFEAVIGELKEARKRYE